MQLANIVHLIMGVFVIGIALGHIYLGSVGTEGVLDGMVSGEVDEGFAKQHHNLWYEEVTGGAAAASEPAPSGEASSAAPT